MDNRLNLFKYICLLLLTIIAIDVQADSAYKNFRLKMEAVPTGKGVVYLNYNISDKDSVTTIPAASIDEKITIKGMNDYYCRLLADPIPGWELVGFTKILKDEYEPEDFFGTTSPTEVAFHFDPMYVFDGQSYSEAQEHWSDEFVDVYQYYAVFRPVSGEGILTPKTEDGQPATTTRSPQYNLSGQRVDKRFRGLVISNGKKILQMRK